jgi:hypothetical protein
VDGDAADVVVVAQLDLTGVQPGADLDVDVAELVTERDRASDRPAGAVEGCTPLQTSWTSGRFY